MCEVAPSGVDRLVYFMNAFLASLGRTRNSSWESPLIKTKLDLCFD